MTGRPAYWVYHYQNGEGSTSHLATTGGALLEWYRYDLAWHADFLIRKLTQLSPLPTAYAISSPVSNGISDLGLYDLRNRFYSPDIGRFLQPDPIGFAGDPERIFTAIAAIIR